MHAWRGSGAVAVPNSLRLPGRRRHRRGGPVRGRRRELVLAGRVRGLWGDRAAAEERVRELLAAEWAVIGPSLLEVAAERIVGDGSIQTWRDAKEATRAKFRVLGEALFFCQCS